MDVYFLAWLCFAGIGIGLSLLKRAEWIASLMIGFSFISMAAYNVSIHQPLMVVLQSVFAGIGVLGAARKHPRSSKLKQKIKRQNSWLFDVLRYEIPYSHKLQKQKKSETSQAVTNQDAVA